MQSKKRFGKTRSSLPIWNFVPKASSAGIAETSTERIVITDWSCGSALRSQYIVCVPNIIVCDVRAHVRMRADKIAGMRTLAYNSLHTIYSTGSVLGSGSLLLAYHLCNVSSFLEA